MKEKEKINNALSGFYFYSGIGWHLLPPNERKYFVENSNKLFLKKGKYYLGKGVFQMEFMF